MGAVEIRGNPGKWGEMRVAEKNKKTRGGVSWNGSEAGNEEYLPAPMSARSFHRDRCRRQLETWPDAYTRLAMSAVIRGTMTRRLASRRDSAPPRRSLAYRFTPTTVNFANREGLLSTTNQPGSSLAIVLMGAPVLTAPFFPFSSLSFQTLFLLSFHATFHRCFY